MAFPYSLTVPLLKDVKSQMPQAICEMAPVSLNRNLLVNRDMPPFDNPDLRRAMALSLDRQGVHRYPHRRTGRHRRGNAAAAGGIMGHAAGDAANDCRAMVPMCRKTARKPARSCRSSVMGPITGSRSRCRCATSRTYRDPAVILIDQLKEVYIDGELEPIDTTNWFPKVMRKDYIVGLTVPEAGPTPTRTFTCITGAARS